MLTNGWCRVGRGLMLVMMMLAIVPGLKAASPEYRALWVDVFHPGLRSQAEADVMLQTARSAGYNTVIIEVRKACDAFYNSSVEPKNLSVQAGFDPLAYIIQQAHRGSPRMEVYAWLVTYRAGMGGDSTYSNPRHVSKRHPEWLGQTRSGTKTANGISYLDPGVPAVVDYTLTVVRDIVGNYDVDGVMFDYIRYPESDGGPSNWGYNPTAIARYNRLAGTEGKPAANDPSFGEFRRRQTYDLVRKVYAHVRAWRPRVKVGAATITWGSYKGDFSRTSAYTDVMQDWEGMTMDGWLDVVMPMNYKREHIPAQAKDHRDWAAYLGGLGQRSGRAAVNIVDGEGLNSTAGILTQINATRNLPGMAGISTYAYAEPRSGSKAVPDREFFSTISSKVFSSPAAVPDAPWLTRPSQGLVKGVVSRGGKPVDGAIVRMGSRSTHTDGTGFYAFAKVNPGNVTVSAEDGQGSIGQGSAAVQAGGVAEAPISGK